VTYFTSAARYSPNLSRLIICGWFLLLYVLNPGSSNAQAPSWEKPFVGSDPSLLYYPDQNAVYFRYGWENNKQQEIVIIGKIPDARYFSFNLYNDYTKSSIAALADHEIVPDDNDASTYTIHILPEGKTGKFKNQIILPDSVRIASVFLRYYLAKGNIYANKPIPQISLLENGVLVPVKPSMLQAPMTPADMAKLKGVIVANPNLISGKERKLLASPSTPMEEKEPIISKVMTVPIFRHFTDPGAINAYNFNSGGNYPNKDNHYIVMPVVRRKDDVLIVRFKAPTHATQLGDISQNVRYFSLSQGNEYTNTSITLYDEQLKVSSDGFIYVVVANDKKEWRTQAGEMGINFMPWLYKERLVLILRHMLPAQSFTSSSRNVPLFDKSRPAKGQEAQKSIGDFALTGTFVKAKNWKKVSNVEAFGFK
jgi:hypothetical protein